MTFAVPVLLWLLLLPALLLAREVARHVRSAQQERPRILQAEAGSRTVSLLPPGANPRRFRARVWFCLGLACAVVALARPQWGLLEEQVFDQSREIVIAMDLSRSMLAQDVKPSRLERSKLLVTSLLERLEGERVGLLLFAGTAFVQSPLSADYEILEEFLPGLSPDTLPAGGSNYGALIKAAAEAFSSTGAADRFLVILSDGDATDEEWKEGVEELKTRGVRVIGLGVGTTAGAIIPLADGNYVKDEKGAVVLSRLGSTTLEELAAATGGVYRDASAWFDLGALLEATVETGVKGQFLEKRRARLAERFQWPLGAALACLFLSFAREFPVRPRPRDLRLPQEAVPLLLAGLLALALMTPSAAQEPEAPMGDPAPPPVENPGLAPLRATVTRLAAQPGRSAADWAEMARNTLLFGEHFKNQQLPVPEAPVNDGLAAVEAGRAVDGKGADWNALQRALEELLKKPEEPQEEPPPEETPPPPEQGGEQNNSQGDSEKEKSEQPGQEGEPEQKDGEQPPSEQDKQPDPNAPPQDDAFGDMDEKGGEITPKEPPPTQEVGGREQKEAVADPSLTLPLEKLEQLKRRDSPARLFELMEADGQPPPKTEKDW